MSGKIPDDNDKGRCKRCDFSSVTDVYGDKHKHRWCAYYDNFCQRVAWNCTAPSGGYRFVSVKRGGEG